MSVFRKAKRYSPDLIIDGVSEDASFTARLQRFMQGDPTVTDDLLIEVLPKLHEIASRELSREHHRVQLSKTELIHEVWLSNLSKGGWQINDRAHFFALASLAIRRLLVNLARKRTALRRNGGASILSIGEFDVFLGTSDQDAETIVEIGILMERLEKKDPDVARVVDMHYFSGFTLEEVAEETGLTFKQVRSRWEKGLKWLKRMLGPKKQQQTIIRHELDPLNPNL